MGLNKAWEDVKIFHKTFKAPVGEDPHMLERERSLARADWMREIGAEPADSDAGSPRFGQFPPREPAALPAPALPNARIMIHQPTGGAKGQASDVKIHAEEILYTRKRLNDLLSKHTKQPLKVIDKDTDRDFFMSAEEALKYGLVDKIIEKR